MKKSLTQFGLSAGLILMAASSSWSQQAPAAPPSTPPSQPSGGASGGSNRGNTNQTVDPSQLNRDNQLPLYVEGQIIGDNGKPPTESISVKLTCGIRTVQTIKTDIRGYFRFALGLGNNQANTDFSAADEGPSPSSIPGMSMPGSFSGMG